MPVPKSLAKFQFASASFCGFATSHLFVVGEDARLCGLEADWVVRRGEELGVAGESGEFGVHAGTDDVVIHRAFILEKNAGERLRQLLELCNLARIGLRILRDVREEVLEALLLREMRGDEALNEGLMRFEKIAPDCIDVSDDAARRACLQDRASAFHAVLRASADLPPAVSVRMSGEMHAAAASDASLRSAFRGVMRLAVLRRLGVEGNVAHVFQVHLAGLESRVLE